MSNMPFLGQRKRTFVRDPRGVQKERSRGTIIYLPLLVSIDDISFLESGESQGMDG